MITLLIPKTVQTSDRRGMLAKALRDLHEIRLTRRNEARRGRLLKYHQARRAERAAHERVSAWRAVQMTDIVA